MLPSEFETCEIDYITLIIWVDGSLFVSITKLFSSYVSTAATSEVLGGNLPIATVHHKPHGPRGLV